jgi:hypothetical protein
MKKIKITEHQAKKLGLLKESDDIGLKSSGNAMGDLIVRVVISGPELPRFKDRALALVLRQDPTADVQYFEATGKIVGNVKDIKRRSIERDLKALDPMISVEKKVATPPKLKEGVRNIVKVTKEQYNRIFASGLINEEVDDRELTKVDAKFKKSFTGGDVKNLKPVSVTEEDGINADTGGNFDIKKPNTELSSSVNGKFGNPMNENEDKVKKETIELIRYLYRKSEDLSPFWEENGLSYDDICSALLDKKLIVKKGGKHELSKALGDPQAAIQALETELRGLVGDKAGKPKNEMQDAPMTDAPMTDAPIDEYDNYNYPAGADADRNAPWHQEDPAEPSKMAKNPQLEPIASNRELTIFKDPQGQLFAFYQDAVDKEELYPYASVERHYTGKDEDGDPQYDYDFDNVEIDGDVVANYVNDNLAYLSKGEGLADWESGVELVKIDDELRQDLLSVYDKDKNMFKVLGGVSEEASFDDAMDSFKDNLRQAATPKAPTGETPEAKQSRIVAKLQDLKKKELERQAAEKAEIQARIDSADIDETDAGSSGQYTTGSGLFSDEQPIKRKMPDVPVVTEMGDGGNYGYDTPGGLTMDLGKNNPKSKAETTPQWAGGSFVKQPACSKMDNNKSAQNGGCNQGASSLKTVKASGSINAPSLGENKIFETIAKKTGKTVEEVKNIINTKKSKA